MVKKIKNTKAYLQTSIIRCFQLDTQIKQLSKARAEVKKDITELMKNKNNYDFSNELHTYALQIIEKFSTIIDTEQMKEDKVYDKYKTKERKSVTFHILKIDNKDIKKRGTK